MTRKRNVIISIDDPAIEVTRALASYTVVYRGDRVAVRQVYETTTKPRYYRMDYTTRGHAEVCAARLNRLFDCQDFTVVQL
jgi:transketolase C-terminal domain/subunit